MAGLTGAQMKVVWNATPLQNDFKNAFRRAGIATKRFAQAKSHSRTVARSMGVSFYSGGPASGASIVGILRARSPLAHLQELGVGPHVIAPSGVRSVRKGSVRLGRSSAIAYDPDAGGTVRGRRSAMKFPDGGFARGPVEHPGHKAYPALRPAAAFFPATFRREAAKSRYLR